MGFSIVFVLKIFIILHFILFYTCSRCFVPLADLLAHNTHRQCHIHFPWYQSKDVCYIAVSIVHTNILIGILSLAYLGFSLHNTLPFSFIVHISLFILLPSLTVKHSSPSTPILLHLYYHVATIDCRPSFILLLFWCVMDFSGFHRKLWCCSPGRSLRISSTRWIPCAHAFAVSGASNTK